MKSTVSDVFSFKLTLVGLIMAGLFLFAPSVSKAQSTVTNFYSVPSGPYVTPATAIVRVEAQCMLLKSQYEVLDPQSQEYRNNEIKYAFYTAILDQLNGGKTVVESLETSLHLFDTDVASGLPKTKRAEYKQEAINMLKL